MPSFFTVPGSKTKRKRVTAPEPVQKKRVAASKTSGKPVARTTSRTGKGPARRPADSSSEDDDDDDDDVEEEDDDDEEGHVQSAGAAHGDGDDDMEGETAAEKRLRLAERYLENVKQQVDEVGFDAAEIDRDLMAERLEEDVAESKGRLYRQLAADLDFAQARQTFFRTNTNAVTAVAVCPPYLYTTTKDLYLQRWKTQELARDQFPQRTKRKPKKAPAPARTRPQLEAWIRGNKAKAREKTYGRHGGPILTVAASPDGKLVVTGGADGKLIVYEAASLKPIKVLTHHRDAITALAFRRGTNQLYSGSRDRTVKVWSLDELAYVETLFGHQDGVADLDALAQERCVSVGARDRTARLWKVAEETQLVFRGGGGSKTATLPPGTHPGSLLDEGSMDRVAMIDEDLFVTGSDNGALALWSVQKKKPVHVVGLAHGLDPPLDPAAASAEQNPDPAGVPPPTPRWITALRTVPYSDLILSASWDGAVRAWRLSPDKKKIEPLGLLGHAGDDDDAAGQEDATDTARPNKTSSDSRPAPRPLRGIINDLAVFERGERGKDGLCVVAAVASEHRLGRWKVIEGVRNGAVIFEVPRRQPSPRTNGTT